MAEIRPRAEGCLVEVVEGSEPTREELSIDHTLGKAVDRAETEAERQFVEPLGDQLLVARAYHRQAVAHHDPVSTGTVELTALAAGVAYHLGIMAFAGHRIGLGIDGAEDVEIKETVIDRRHQRIRHRMRKPHQVAVGAGRIDHNEIEGVFNGADRIRELQQLGILVIGDVHGQPGLDAAMHRQLEFDTGAAGPGLAVVDVAGKTLLATVEVDCGDPLAGLHQGDGDMQGGGGFPRSALFVAQHHNVCRTGLPLTSLHEHDSTPDTSSSWPQPRSSEMRGPPLELLKLGARS